MTVAIAWGDLATAYVSTGIPNIETYASMPPAAAIASRAQLGTIASAPVQHLLVRIADRSKGPSEEELRTGRSRFWGEVRNSTGERRTARLETANGYRLTADGMIMAVKFLLEHAPAGGYYTPSMLMGARCVEQLPGSTPIRVDLRRRSDAPRAARLPRSAQQLASPTGLRACLWFAGGAHILEMNGDSYRLNQSKRRSRRASSDTPADNQIQA
jgi:hypothetical protein